MNQIAVLIPVYNRQNKLLQTLKSIKCDTNLKTTVVVVDDGSDENIYVPCDTKHITHNLLRIDNNKGIEYALNTGLDYILENNFKFISRIDAGDLMINNRIHKQIEFLNKHPEIGVVGSSMIKSFGNDINETSKVITDYDHVEYELKKRNHMIHPSLTIRTSVFKNIDTYSYDYPAAEDYELLMRIINKTNFRITNINEPLIVYEVTDDSISVKHARKQMISEHLVKIKYFNFFKISSYLGFISTNTIKLLLPNWLIITIRVIKAKL